MKLHTVSGYKSKQAAKIWLIGPFGFLRVCVEKSGTTLYLLLLTNVWLSSGQITMSTGNTAVPYVEYVNFFLLTPAFIDLPSKCPYLVLSHRFAGCKDRSWTSPAL